MRWYRRSRSCVGSIAAVSLCGESWRERGEHVGYLAVAEGACAAATGPCRVEPGQNSDALPVFVSHIRGLRGLCEGVLDGDQVLVCGVECGVGGGAGACEAFGVNVRGGGVSHGVCVSEVVSS